MLNKLLIISSLSVSLVFSGCGKKVVNPAKTNDLDKQGAMNGDAEGKKDTGKDIDDLKNALDKEREERIKGDQDLQTQITLLIATLAQISIKIATTIGNLDKDSKETQTQLADYIKANDKNLADLAAKITQSNTDLAKQMRIEINIELQKLRDEQTQANQAMKDEIAILIADLEAKLTKQDADLAADLRAEFLVEAKRIEESLEAFKAEAAITYATKAELNVLAASVEGIKKALTVLSQKFDADLKTLADAVHAEHNSDILLLQSQITLIRADMTTIAADLYKMEQTLNLKINNLKKDIRDEISSIKIEISQIQKQDAIQIAAITALSIKLTARTEYLFQFFSAVTKELTTKVQILQTEVNNVSNDQKDYIKLQISQLEQKIKDLADEERAARAEIEEQIRDVSDQIVALEIFARENRALIIANRANIEKTNQDLAKKRAGTTRTC